MQAERDSLDPGTSGGNPQAFANSHYGAPRDAQKDGNSGKGTIDLRRNEKYAKDEVVDPEYENEMRCAQLAQHLRVPQDILKQAFTIFQEQHETTKLEQAKGKARRENSENDPDSEVDIFQDVTLNEQGFCRVLCQISGCSSARELPEGLLTRSFNDADGHRSRKVTFLAFALWYSRHGFMENVLLTNSQRLCRKLAKKFGLPVLEVEQYKKTFDEADEDDSGNLDLHEFTNLCNQLIKVPADWELPAGKVKKFWQEADGDHNGFVSFEEFVIFYSRYFRVPKNGTATCPFEEYYRGFRKIPLPVTGR